MTAEVSFQEYCDNPTKYGKIWPDNTIKYWDQICSARKALKDLGEDSEDLVKYVEHFSIKDLQDVGEVAEKAFTHFIQVMLTPQNLGFLAGIIGLNIASKQAFKFLVNKLVTNFSTKFPESITAEMSSMVEEEGMSAAAVNASALLTSVIDESVSGLYTAGASILKLLEEIGDIIPVLGKIMMLFFILGMIFDAWDPCHLEDELNSETIYQFNNNFNIVFRENILVYVNSFTDPYGNVYFVDSWPIDFYADRVLANQKEDYYAKKRMRYMARWLNSREFNSNNQPIYWPKEGSLINNNTLDKISKNLSINISDDNTVVANWVYKFFPIIIFVIIIIIILIFYLIK